MNNLTNTNAIRTIDPQDTLGSTELMVQQLEAAWKDIQNLHTTNIGKVTNIIFCGMGASIYGALVVKALLGSKFPYPTEIISDYHLPDYVDSSTLVVLTSYSGTTEEVLSCAQEAKEKSAKMIVLTKGGELATFAKDNNIPAYIFDGKLNPAGVPRLGNGYTIIGLMGLLQKTGVITLDDDMLVSAIKKIGEKLQDIKKTAMDHSQHYVDRIPVIFAAEHLNGNAQILRNQFNETSKQFSAYYLVPDLNHHLMEGLQFPKNSKLRFLTFQSKNYSPKIQKRMQLTFDVVKQNHHDIDMWKTTGSTMYEDFLEVLAYGSFLTLYLGLRNDQNPAINPWVDYFKDQLKK